MKYALGFVQISAGLVLSFTSPGLADTPEFEFKIDLGPDVPEIRPLAADASLEVRQALLAKFKGLDLSGRDLRQAEIHADGYELSDAVFDGADLTGANLVDTIFDNCSFHDAKLHRVSAGSSAFLMSNCIMTDAEISGAEIYLSPQQLMDTSNFENKNLSGIKLSGAFHEIDFSGFDLSNSELRFSARNCNFEQANISGARLTSWSAQQIKSTMNFRKRDFHGVTFYYCDFSNLDLSGFELGYFHGCDFTSTNLDDACFSATMPDGDGEKYGFSHCKLSAAQFYATRTYKSRKFPHGAGTFQFRGMDLSEWDFSWIDLRGVRFHGCNLANAKFLNARGGLFWQCDLSKDQVQEMWNYKEKRLGEAGFEIPDALRETLR